MPRLRGTALEARVPFAELEPWSRGGALEARSRSRNNNWLRGTPLKALVPAVGTTP